MKPNRTTPRVRNLALAGLTLAATIALGVACERQTLDAEIDRDSQVARGRYLVTICVCNDCHTPWKVGPNGPEPDMSRMLSGHPQDVKVDTMPKLDRDWVFAGGPTMTAWAGPWGISFTANLTPDVKSGLGTWTEERFITAIRSGKHWGVSRPIMPPMPWKFYSQMTDADLKAVWAYLRTIPAVENEVPDWLPPDEAKPAK
jgi:mono/diheme cytochrome c family protein